MRAVNILIASVLIICGCSGEFPSKPAQIRAAVDSYDKQRLRHSLDAIKAWHRANKTGVDSALKPGLSEADLSTKQFTDECRLTEELKALWSWHNGETGPRPFIWYHDFISLEEAVSEYRWLTLNPLEKWDPHYVPIMSFEGEWYGAYCGALSEVAGPIIHYYLEDGARVTARNLTTFMATMSQVLDAGAVKWINGAMVEDILLTAGIDMLLPIHEQLDDALEE